MLQDAERSPEAFAERVLADIHTRIESGALAPGSRINELEIAQRLKMSRGPVREAVRSLSARGLVVAEPNVGARIVTLDPDLIRELYDVREELEALGARLAAQHMSEDERRRLTSVLREHEAVLGKEGPRAYPGGGPDKDFHILILKGSRNRVVWRICAIDLFDLLTLARRQHHLRPARSRRALIEHQRIAEAILDRNGDLAALLMAQHVRASRDNLLAAAPDHSVQARQEI